METAMRALDLRRYFNRFQAKVIPDHLTVLIAKDFA